MEGNKNLQKAAAVQDDSGHWYVIPHSLLNEFMSDSENEEFIESGGFDEKYGKYMTGGCLSNTEIYAYF